MWKWVKKNALLIGAAILGLVFFFKDLVLDILIGNARKISNDAKKTDADLRDEEAKANAEAERLRAEAARLGKEVDKADPNEDWHKE